MTAVTLLVSQAEMRNPLKWPYFDGLRQSALAEGIDAHVAHSIKQPTDGVIGWGYGAWWRNPHVVASRWFAMLDLGYFGRNGRKNDCPVRVAFNKMHNPELVSRDWPSDRWDALGIGLRDDFDPKGHVVLVGQGRKSCQMYGEKPGEWERRWLSDLRVARPNSDVLFRPKPGRGHITSLGKVPIVDGAIENALRGASLVVCRHSNVALDALIAGVPVVCEGGLAAAMCPRTPANAYAPLSEALRLKVLRCAAWLNWRREEVERGELWRLIKTVIS